MRSSPKPSIVAATLLALILVIGGPPIRAQEASPSPSPSPATAAPTPVPLARVPSEMESTFGELHQMEENNSKDEATLKSTASSLSNLATEIQARMAEDTRILSGDASLDMLYRLRTTWQTFTDSLSSSEQDLVQRVSNLESQITRLNQMKQVWQTTLQSADKVEMPPPVLQRVQSVVDEIAKAQQKADSDRTEVLTLQSSLLLEDARIRTAVGAVAQAQDQALKDLLVQDGQPIWTAPATLTSEWQKQSGETFSAQLDATSAFVRRAPFSFVLHAICFALLAIFIEWLRRRIRKLGEIDPTLQRAVPILGLPFSTAFVLSVVLIPSVYLQAPRWIQAVMGAVALIPTVLILRRLLERNLFPILYALVGLYFVTQLRVLAASLPVLARFLFLVQTVGGFLFLLWLLRSGKLAAAQAGTTNRFSRALRIIAKIGLVMFPAAILANVLGYLNLANLLGFVYVRSVFLAALLYVVIRVLEGFIIIGLQVRPLGLCVLSSFIGKCCSGGPAVFSSSWPSCFG